MRKVIVAVVSSQYLSTRRSTVGEWRWVLLFSSVHYGREYSMQRVYRGKWTTVGGISINNQPHSTVATTARHRPPLHCTLPLTLPLALPLTLPLALPLTVATNTSLKTHTRVSGSRSRPRTSMNAIPARQAPNDLGVNPESKANPKFHARVGVPTAAGMHMEGVSDRRRGVQRLESRVESPDGRLSAVV